MKMNRIGLVALLAASAALTARAQMAVEADPAANTIFSSKNTGTTTSDGIAVRGESKPQPYYGIGVYGEGGWKGVQGYCNVAGTGTRYGGEFSASGGTSNNYGVFASASGTGAYAGYFVGNVYVSGTFSNPSDPRLKRDVQGLTGSLGKVMALNPSTYYFDNSRLKVQGLPQGKQIGLLADEVQRVLPELVHQVNLETGAAPGPGDKEAAAAPETYQTVNYIGLVPVLVGAIREQQAQITALKQAIADLKK